MSKSVVCRFIKSCGLNPNNGQTYCLWHYEPVYGYRYYPDNGSNTNSNQSSSSNNQSNSNGSNTNGFIPGDTDELRRFENDYKAQMSEREIQIYSSMNRHAQVTYLLNAKSALLTAESEYPGSQHNTKADAFRHAYFSMLNAWSFGAPLAKALGYAHEEMPNNPSREKQMDLHNNNEGRNAIQGRVFDPPLASRFISVGRNLVSHGNLQYINTFSNLVNTNQ